MSFLAAFCRVFECAAAGFPAQGLSGGADRLFWRDQQVSYVVKSPKMRIEA
jgi:hypothetical protein